MINFDILLEIQPPTTKQLAKKKYLLLHKMISQEAENFRMALLRIVDERLNFSCLDSKECLLVKFSRTGKHKIEFSSIKDKHIRSHVRRVIESSYPIFC